MAKIKKSFIAVGTVVALLPSLTGCSAYKLERADAVNDKITHMLKVETADLDTQVKDYKLIGADVAKTAFDFGVKFNGVCELDNGENAFASVDYVVPSSYFVNLQKDSDTKNVFNVLDKITTELKHESFTITPVSDLSNISEAFVKNCPTPFEGYSVDYGMVYNLGRPVFDDENKTVSFDVKTLIELRKFKPRTNYGLSYGFNGTICLGFNVSIVPPKVTGTFTTLDKYTLTVNNELYDQMKKDDKLVYDKCVESFNEQNKHNIKAERIVTSYVTYNEADLLDALDMNELEESLNM